MKAQNKLRELNLKEMKAVSGGIGVKWGGVKGGNGGYVQFFMGSRPGKG
ncbi:hypothetical protein JMY81_21580 [Brenneria goodwinii]|uniref:Uncharacterized protein n=1 Tax=Brenneria goodwinii TaxID=1109412 RepID=A0A0G4JUD0_9GAMM|nr:hypothetical protein [Brenneria goodwinii]MCG8158812.1 hypothetical protein [Brenneria goodwinii]MCG8163385.1 hypothetical protein [Brenneria goodwinii]MCG8167941.1 hypothetical protein [Brenneria goodwinii]MCG8172536.1 hypothetical protein [Brenneria goodwinii]MCG8177271.1 hypothetical protein [Brenneria goodwinii]